MPHVAMLPLYEKSDWRVSYIGTASIEKKLIQEKGCQFYEIRSGKLRRYLSWQNLWDVFNLFLGFLQSLFVLLRLRPQLVFSKGGYVSVPVCFAAWILRIPVVTHESDLTPGLANRLILPITTRLFYAFKESERFFKGKNSIHTRSPVRLELLSGDAQRGRDLTGFGSSDLPVVLIMGGSLGAQRINDFIEEHATEILRQYQVMHLTGAGKATQLSHGHYWQREFAKEELADLFALSDVVIARAGANSLFEFLALEKPMLLIPLKVGSRGDQIDNAKSFHKSGFAEVMDETNLAYEEFSKKLKNLVQHGDDYRQAMRLDAGFDPGEEIFRSLDQIVKSSFKA